MDAATYNSAKAALKQEICGYFTDCSVSHEVLKKVVALIKKDAENGTYYTLSKLAPRHHAITTKFIDTLCHIEAERDEFLYQQEINSLEYQQALGQAEIETHDYGYNY